jgi:hypothetical protein
MLFINPMWNSETERIGKQRCTPLGYALHGISEEGKVSCAELRRLQHSSAFSDDDA